MENSMISSLRAELVNSNHESGKMRFHQENNPVNNSDKLNDTDRQSPHNIASLIWRQWLLCSLLSRQYGLTASSSEEGLTESLGD